MSPLAKAAKEAFHEVLKAKGRRLDQKCLDDAWNAAAKAVLDCMGVHPMAGDR